MSESKICRKCKGKDFYVSYFSSRKYFGNRYQCKQCLHETKDYWIKEDSGDTPPARIAWGEHRKDQRTLEAEQWRN